MTHPLQPHSSGKWVRTIDRTTTPNSGVRQPVAVAISPDKDRVFVTDAVFTRVRVLSARGHCVCVLGTATPQSVSTSPGVISHTCGITVTSLGHRPVRGGPSSVCGARGASAPGSTTRRQPVTPPVVPSTTKRRTRAVSPPQPSHAQPDAPRPLLTPSPSPSPSPTK